MKVTVGMIRPAKVRARGLRDDRIVYIAGGKIQHGDFAVFFHKSKPLIGRYLGRIVGIRRKR